MAKIQITKREYSNLLKIAYACQFYLDEGLPSTEKRLKEYLKEFNNQ